MSSFIVAVYGATGITGRLVVRELLTRGIACRALGRDARALAALRTELGVETRACPAETAASALADVDVVINCAGPFVRTRRLLEDAARGPVVHICGEPSQLVELFARDDLAIPVVGGAGFSPAVAELAAWLALKGLTRVERLEVVHAATASVPSEGSLLSYLHDVELPIAPADGADDIQVVELPAPIGARAVRRALLAESVALRKSTGVADVRTFVSIGPPRIAAAPIPVYMRDRAALEQMLAHRVGQRGPGDEERAASRFAVSVTARAGASVQHVEMTGADPYAVTAIIAAQTAVDVLGHAAGAFSALEVLAPQPALAALARAGVRWTVRRSRLEREGDERMD